MPPPPPVFVCAAELQEHTARIFSQLPARSTIPGAVHAGTHSAAPQLCETCDHAIPTVTVMPQHFSPLLPAPEAHMEPIWASTSVELPCVTGITLSMEQGAQGLIFIPCGPCGGPLDGAQSIPAAATHDYTLSTAQVGTIPLGKLPEQAAQDRGGAGRSPTSPLGRQGTTHQGPPSYPGLHGLAGQHAIITDLESLSVRGGPAIGTHRKIRVANQQKLRRLHFTFRALCR